MTLTLMVLPSSASTSVWVEPVAAWMSGHFISRRAWSRTPRSPIVVPVAGLQSWELRCSVCRTVGQNDLDLDGLALVGIYQRVGRTCGGLDVRVGVLPSFRMFTGGIGVRRCCRGPSSYPTMPEVDRLSTLT